VSAPEVVIIRTGTANLASVGAAFARLGARATITEEPEVVRSAPLVVLPGVGAFGAAMARLRERRVDEALLDRVRMDRPVLAICLGMQLLCEVSEESPGVRGLGVMEACVTRFPGCVRVPQMGWSVMTPDPGARWLRPSWVYFANSYRVESLPEGWIGSRADYGAPYVPAVERGAVLACQFHPELSGAAGLSLIGRWLGCAGFGEVRAC